MSDDWILAVLRDLRSFAELNRLPFLAESLEEASRLAEVEIRQRDGQPAASGASAALPLSGPAGASGRLRGV